MYLINSPWHELLGHYWHWPAIPLKEMAPESWPQWQSGFFVIVRWVIVVIFNNTRCAKLAAVSHVLNAGGESFLYVLRDDVCTAQTFTLLFSLLNDSGSVAAVSHQEVMQLSSTTLYHWKSSCGFQLYCDTQQLAHWKQEVFDEL